MTKDEFKALRDRYGQTQGQLATRLGVTSTTIHRWENGLVAVPKWAETWFRGEFQNPDAPVWRGFVANWYGNPQSFRQLPGVFISSEDALAAAKKVSHTTDHWALTLPAPYVVIIERT